MTSRPLSSGSPSSSRGELCCRWPAPWSTSRGDTRFDITVIAFGEACAPCTLVEDDGESADFEKGKQNIVTLTWSAGKGGKVSRQGGYHGRRYAVTAWKRASEH